jgi:hypothetical protein
LLLHDTVILQVYFFAVTGIPYNCKLLQPLLLCVFTNNNVEAKIIFKNKLACRKANNNRNKKTTNMITGSFVLFQLPVLSTRYPTRHASNGLLNILPIRHLQKKIPHSG